MNAKPEEHLDRRGYVTDEAALRRDRDLQLGRVKEISHEEFVARVTAARAERLLQGKIRNP